MTFSRLFILGFISWLGLALCKLLFLNVLNLDNFLFQVLFGFFVVVFSLALSRRLGVINYLEALFTAFTWFFIAFVLDFIILSRLLGIGLFSHWLLWASYILLILSVVFFHKKRHIHIRKEQAAQHGHH